MEYFTGLEATIKMLPRPEKGEIAYASDTKKFFKYDGEAWQELGLTPNSELNLSLYDMNKQIVSQLPVLLTTDKSIADIDTFVKETSNTHYMMYGQEISYFTIFQRCSGLTETVGEAVIDCLKNVGMIKSIELTEDKSAFEIWVTDDNGESTCLYLFPYDNGIVQVGG